jgi:hypothetical protein
MRRGLDRRSQVGQGEDRPTPAVRCSAHLARRATSLALSSQVGQRHNERVDLQKAPAEALRIILSSRSR